jgi:hypothetical protein
MEQKSGFFESEIMKAGIRDWSEKFMLLARVFKRTFEKTGRSLGRRPVFIKPGRREWSKNRGFRKTKTIKPGLRVWR